MIPLSVRVKRNDTIRATLQGGQRGLGIGPGGDQRREELGDCGQNPWGACRLWPRQKGEQGLPLWILPLESGREEGMWREAEEVLSRWALAAGDSLNER